MIQDEWNEQFNRPEYNNWHKFDRHRGYSNPRKALADHVDAEDKTDGVTIRDSIGREQNPILINESGLYSLILRSQFPKAKQFKRWVTSEVFPVIRRHGVYAIDEIL